MNLSNWKGTFKLSLIDLMNERKKNPTNSWFDSYVVISFDRRNKLECVIFTIRFIWCIYGVLVWISSWNGYFGFECDTFWIYLSNKIEILIVCVFGGEYIFFEAKNKNVQWFLKEVLFSEKKMLIFPVWLIVFLAFDSN